MTEYTHRLTTTADLKRLNLQNMQLSIKVAELMKENQALKDELAKRILAKEKEQCN